MLSAIQKDNFKVASITLVLAFMVIAEPILAQDKRSDSGKSGGSSLKSEQARHGLTGFRFQRPLDVIKPPASIAQVSASSSPQTSNSRFPLKAGTMPSLQPGGPTLSRTPVLQRQSSFGIGRLAGGGMSTGVSSSIAGGTAVSSGNRTSLDKGPSIVSSTNQKSSFVIKQREPAAASSTNRFSQNRTSQIGSLIGTRSLSTATVVKRPNIGADNSAGSDRTLRIDSLIGKKETSSPILAKPPIRSGVAADQSKEITRDWIGGSRTRPGEMPDHSQTSSIKNSRLGSVTSDRIQRLGSLIGKERTSTPILRKRTADDEPKRSIEQTGQNHNSPQGRTDKIAETSRTRKDINLKSVDRLLPSSRPGIPHQLSGGARTTLPEDGNKDKVVIGAGSDSQTTIAHSNVISETGRVDEGPRSAGTHTHRHGLADFSPPHVTGHTYPQAVRHIHHHEHVYWDCHNRLCHKIVWPTYCFVVHYGYGPYFTFRYVYPYHFRRYIFVSLGGYWPIGYRCIRYYWYGCHPYTWYGYYPIAYEVKGDTYNYYTYNYYYDDDGIVASESSQVVDGIRPVDHNTFADVREKLAQQKAEEPEPETLADTYFDEAVKAFEAGDYNIAIEKFAKAIELAPDDMVVPFAYSQALFATEQYSEAAKVLRTALAKVCPGKEGVFYPRGLYSDDKILFEQIEHLTKKAELYSFDADLQLLLGYQLLGIGEIDKAIEPLQRASQDFENAAAATTLLDLLAKIKTDNETEKNSD